MHEESHKVQEKHFENHFWLILSLGAALCEVLFLKKIIITTKNRNFWKKINFGSFHAFFFRNSTFLRAEVFCVAFSASRRLFWSFKINYWTIFQIFHYKEGPFWFWGGPSATRRGRIGQKWFSKCLSRTLWLFINFNLSIRPNWASCLHR